VGQIKIFQNHTWPCTWTIFSVPWKRDELKEIYCFVELHKYFRGPIKPCLRFKIISNGKRVSGPEKKIKNSIQVFSMIEGDYTPHTFWP
jgi:hypothetical protein